MSSNIKLQKYKTPKTSLAPRLLDWKFSADSFYKASEVLWMKDRQGLQLLKAGQMYGKYSPTIGFQYFLMIGYSLENDLKGIIVYHNPQLMTMTMDSKIKHHSLVKLAKQTTLTTSSINVIPTIPIIKAI